MEPGDEVILPYEEYSQLKNAAKEYPALVEESKELKKVNEELAHKLEVTQQKLVLKNGLLCKQQFKSEYLMSLFDDLNTAFGIKAEAIGKDMKFLRNMDETYFSVIQLPGEVDEDERLPDNFSKSNTYIEVDTELHAYRNLAEICTKEWSEKQKVIEYLEQSLKTSENKDIKKIEEEAEKMEKELKTEVEKLTAIIVDLESDVKRISDEKSYLQAKNDSITSMVEALKANIGDLLSSTEDLRKENMKVTEELNDLNKTVRQQEEKILNMTSNLESKNFEIETHLKEEIECLNDDKNLLKQKLIENEQTLVAKINNLEKKIIQLEENNRVLRNEVESLQIETDERIKFAQLSTEKIDQLKNEIEKLEKEILHLRTSTPESKPSSSSSSSEHVTDIKSKLFSLISEYIIYLNKQMMEIELTVAEKKTIIRSEVLEVEEQFGKELKKLKL